MSQKKPNKKSPAAAVRPPAPVAPAPAGAQQQEQEQQQQEQQQELHRLSLQFMERIRAIEYGKLQLERKLEQAELANTELLIKSQEELLSATRSAAASLKSESERNQKAERVLRQRLELFTAEASHAGGVIRELQNELRESRDAHAAELEQARQVLEQAAATQQARFETQARQDLARFEEERGRLVMLLDERSTALGGVRADLGQAQDQLQESRQVLQRLEAELTHVRSEATRAADRLANAFDVLADREKALQDALVRGEKLDRQRQSLESQLEQFRHERAELEAAVDRQQQELVVERQQMAALLGSTRLGVGTAVVEAFTSWRGFVRFPLRLYRVVRAAAARRRAGPASPDVLPLEEHVARATALLATEGVGAAEAYVVASLAQPHEKAHVLTLLAKQVFASDPERSLRLGEAAQGIDPRDYREKWLAFLRFDIGQVVAAATALDALPKGATLKASERFRANQILGSARLMQSPPAVPERAEPYPGRVPGRVMYVAASALPYHQSGYTLRTQSLLGALRQMGIDVACVTRPGYPLDRPDALSADDVASWQVGDVSYRRVSAPDRRRMPSDAYLQAASEALFESAQELGAAVIHAASNYETALPALVAARRLGLPFIYEVRGLWELTAASKQAGWETSERFALERALEILVATNADRVLTLNQAMADELVQRGVRRERIAIAPNAVNPDQHKPVERDPLLARSLGLEEGDFVVGYAGSLVGYEGLDDLVNAIASVASRQARIRLLVLGDGEQRTALQELAAERGVADRVVFAGRIPSADVAARLALCDAVALPRKPVSVCRLVSPIKLLEAMAMGLPVIVSGVDPLREVVDHGVTGLVHVPGDVESLSQAILLLADDADLRSRIARAGREWALTQANWTHVAQRLVDAYRDVAPDFPSVQATVVPELEPLPIPANRNAMTAEEKAALDQRLATAHARGGAAAVTDLLQRQIEGHSGRFAAFCWLKGAATCLAAGDVQATHDLSERAVAASDDGSTVRGAATLQFNIGNDDRAGQWIDLLRQRDGSSEALDALARQVDARVWLRKEAARRQPVATVSPQARRSVNFLHFSLPYTSVGYATRSHGIAQGVQASGWDIRPYTRPGFPQDFKPELEGSDLPLVDEVDGVHYRRLFDGGRRGLSEAEYLVASADRCEQVLRDERPAVVHAASNYSTALPALIAARRIGLPFIYEVRGFWEITRSSRDAAFENSTKFRAMQMLEDLVVKNADHVITITGAMKDSLVDRGVDPERISLAYNSVDPERFLPVPRDHELAARLGLPEGVPVIGYVGSFVDYEGLDDLVVAAARLMRDGVDFRLLLVGDGAAMVQLQALIESEGLLERTVVTGRVPHEEVEAYYSLIDIAPFPRKPWQVCELVSPLKPFEAMAMEKAVVVSGTRALLEIVTDGETGLVFEKGDVESLTSALARLAGDAALRARLGHQAREWICEFRSWSRAGRDIAAAYDHVLAGHALLPDASTSA